VSAGWALLLALVAAGCGDSSGVGRTVPVRGTVTLDGTPVTAASTVVLFKPDESKGNRSPFEPVGTVDGQGNYALRTGGKKGAPPGWYKVVVTATDERISPATKDRHPAPKSLLPAPYGSEATTPFAVEVVEEPAAGAYDLKLTNTPSPGK
jgi:hypothetical protein